ncbi:MAG TPA: DUF4350 domain-containing protein [Thermoanaerobaculia bacterium]|jgi:hypothetical protein
MRRTFAVLLLLSFRLAAQQVADPEFDARVASPRYARSHPRLLFDEGHHNVHRTSTTYKAFADLLANDGFRIETNSERFTARSLAPYRVLVIAGALGAPLDDPAANAPAFTPDEVAAVRDWVRRGGGLLLLTDHEPVASAEAALTEAFGIVPSRRVVVDSEHAMPRMHPSNVVATRENGLLAAHAITAGAQRVMVFGGQALRFPRGATILIRTGAQARNDDGGAVDGNAQAGALRYGRGRVVVTADMGMLSAQLFTENGTTSPWGMNVPGIDNRALVLGIAHWLAR